MGEFDDLRAAGGRLDSAVGMRRADRVPRRGWRLNFWTMVAGALLMLWALIIGVFVGGIIYARLGLTYIEPTLREDRGEVEAARDGTLPDLVTLAELGQADSLDVVPADLQ